MAIDGTKIIDSDLAWDIYDDFFERFDAGTDPALIKAELSEEYEGEILRNVDREIFLTTLVECLWSVGTSADDLSAEIQPIIDSEETAEFWEDLYPARKRVLKRFVAKLRKPKKTPIKPSKRRIPKIHLFQEGDYLVFTKRNGKPVPAIIWCVETRGGLSYVFVFPNLTRTEDAQLIQKLLDTNLPIADEELATFFSKSKRTKCVEVAHQAIKTQKSRFYKFGFRPFDHRIWQGSSFGFCETFECLEKYADQAGSRALLPQELDRIGFPIA
jgi:hypothetical protein